jgi:hypothetical protein
MMTLLADHIRENISTNLSQIVDYLSMWSASVNPLIKASKFLEGKFNKGDIYIISIEQQTQLLAINIMPLLGLDATRPWASIATIQHESYEKGCKDTFDRMRNKEDTSLLSYDQLSQENCHLKETIAILHKRLDAFDKVAKKGFFRKD